MATVDSLNIQISAQANSASASIDKLSTKLDTLSTSLNSINASGLSGLSNSVQRLGKSMQTLNGIKATDFTRIAKGVEKFAKIDVSGLSKASGGINTLARSFSSLSSIQNLGNITPTINAIKNLARVNMSGFDTTKLQEISSTISTLGTSLAGTGKIEPSVARVVNAVARLSSSGQYIGNVTVEFPKIGKAVVKLVKDLSGAGSIDANITKVVDGIARLASAGKKAGETAANMKKLGDSVINLLNRLKNAPAINANIASTLQGLGNLAVSGSRISTISDSASVRTTRFGNALRVLKDRLTGANKASKGFVSNIGMFYAKAFLLIRAVKKLGGAIGSAQDYIEEFNYFSVALDKIGKDSASQFKEAGYSSAEEYAKSFRTRFAKLQTQMTGYEVDYDTGEAMSKGIHNLGLDLTEVMNFNAAIAQITNSAGMLGETSIMASKALSMLSADWSSLSNQDLSDVMNNMQSALIGQSRAVYKYGIDITSAGLAQTALNHGIKVSIKDLSQQSKMQLRVLTMLEQSKVAYGDLARTINQPSNQLRQLQAGFKSLSTSIGKLFLPVVQKLYPYLNAIVMVLQQFVQWIAKTAGIKLGDVSGVSLPDYEEPTDGMDDYADATDKAAKKQKKLNDNLQGFDIINKLQKDESDSGDKDDKKNTNIDLSNEIGSALANYEKIWDKAFKSNQNKAVQLANKIKKALLDGWNKGGDFTELGKRLGTWINKGMNKIPWDKIKKTTNKVVKSIATFLNGAVKGLDWKKVGENIADGLNTAIGAAYTWWTTFDWLKFGTSLSTMLNSALKKFDAKLLGKTLGAKLRGVVQFAFGFVTNFNFKQLGTKISDAINGFFEDMGNVDKRTGLTGWQEMGKSISGTINGFADTIITALDNVRWGEVGKAIGQFLGSIDWTGILTRLGKIIVKALFAVIKTAFSAFAEDPLGVANSLVSVLGAIFVFKKLKRLKGIFTTLFGTSMRQGIAGVTGLEGSFAQRIGSLTGSAKLQGACTKLGKAMNTWMALQIEGVAITGIGSSLKNWGEESDTKWLENFGTGIERFGEFTNKLLSLDLKGVTGDIVEVGYILEEISNPEKATSRAEAKQKGTEKQQKENEKIKGYVDNYNKAKERYGQENADLYLKNIANKEDKKKVEEYLNALKSLEGFKSRMKKFGDEGEIAVNLLNKAFDNGSISLSSYKKLVSGNYKNYTHFNAELRKAKNAQKYMNGNVKAFNSLSGKMDKSLKNIGYSGEELTSVQEALNQSLDNGELSFEDYKKIVGKSYASTKDLYNQVNKIAGKKVAAEVVADVKGANDVKKLNSEIGKATSKNIRVKAETEGISNVKDLKIAMENLSNKIISVTINPKLREKWSNIVQRELYKRTFTINAKTKVIKSKGKEVEKATKSQTGGKGYGSKLKELMNKAGTTQDKDGAVVIPGMMDYGVLGDKEKNEKLRKKAKEAQMSKRWKKLIQFLKKNGIKTNNPILFEKGGFPEDGWFRANHGEIMGKFDNGQSVVANNQQITEGIAQAVGPAVYAAVKAAMNEHRGNGESIIINLDGRKIAESTVREVNNMTKQKGRNPIIGYT